MTTTRMIRSCVIIMSMISVVTILIFGIGCAEKNDYFFIPNINGTTVTFSLNKINENLSISKIGDYTNKGLIYKNRVYFVDTDQEAIRMECLTSSELDGNHQTVLFEFDSYDTQLYSSNIIVQNDILYMPIGKWLDNRTHLAITLLLLDLKTSAYEEVSDVSLINGAMFDVSREGIYFLDRLTLCPYFYNHHTGTSYALSDIKANLMSNLFHIDGKFLYYLSETNSLIQLDLTDGTLKEIKIPPPERDDYLYWVHNGSLYYFCNYYSESIDNTVYYYADLFCQDIDSGGSTPYVRSIPYDRYAGATLTFGTYGMVLVSYTQTVDLCQANNKDFIVVYVPYSTQEPMNIA